MNRPRSAILFEALAVVGLLAVPNFVRALYAFLHPDVLAQGGEHSQLGFVGHLLEQLFLLAVVWQIVRLNGESLRDFTEPLVRIDVLRAIGLAIAGYAAYWAVVSTLSSVAPRFVTEWDRPKSLDHMRAPLTAAYLAYMIMNPHYEELIIRGFLQTRLAQAGFSSFSIVMASTLLQAGYHIYQGLPAALGLWAAFLFWGAYYRKHRRIWPVVGAHLIMDLMGALVTSQPA